MSKVDGQRAMRDARYAAYRVRREAEGNPIKDAPGSTPAAAARRSASTVAAAAQDDEPAAEVLCGHRSIGNKSCMRPAGHEEENHRYK